MSKKVGFLFFAIFFCFFICAIFDFSSIIIYIVPGIDIGPGSAVKIKKRSLQIKRSLHTKKDLKESLVIKYPKSGINGLWEERSRWTYLDSLFP